MSQNLILVDTASFSYLKRKEEKEKQPACFFHRADMAVLHWDFPGC
jgi:hypothetical protein